MNKTRWGTTLTHADFSLKRFSITSESFFEIDPGVCFDSKHFALRFSHWFLGGSTFQNHLDRRVGLLEHILDANARVATLRVTERQTEDPETPERVSRLLEQLHGLPFSLYFDFGQNKPPSWVDPNQCVYDPMWFEARPWSDYWKVHGWHSERWVRLYSASQIEKLMSKAFRYHPRFVVLGHSERLAQMAEIQQNYLSETA